jgi:hypothetical protein
MTTAQVVKQVKAPADAVWTNLSNFAAIKAGGPIQSVAYEGRGIGMVRTLGMNGGLVVERLDVHDPGERTFAYSIINDDSPLPFTGYSAVVKILDNGDGTTTVDWTGTFNVKGVPEADAIRLATGIYAGAIKGAQLALEK